MIKHLIIKSSFSKLKDGQLKSNLGDLVRSTILLNCINDMVYPHTQKAPPPPLIHWCGGPPFKVGMKGVRKMNSSRKPRHEWRDVGVYWLTDKRAVSVLRWFIDMDRIFTFEDGIGQCDFSDETKIYNIDNVIFDSEIYKKLHGKWHGFIWDNKDDLIPENHLIANTIPYNIINNKCSWQQSLIEGMGFNWAKQDYPEVNSSREIIADVGFNWSVHPDWESKRWPEENWRELERLLSKKCSVSWQEGLNNVDMYKNWLSSCKIIVTGDSFGLHLASALRKQVVVITGPTDSNEYPYNRLTLIKYANRSSCMPCNLPRCKFCKTCLSRITPQRVRDVIVNILARRIE